MLGKIFLSLFAKTLEINLYRILQSAIGRYSETLTRLLTFGMRVIKVQLIESGIERVEACEKSFNHFITNNRPKMLEK